MEISNDQTSLDTERGQTDTSLHTERGKTDDSFADHRKQTESETNRRVRDGRDGADEARTRSRAQSDSRLSAGPTLQAQRARDDANMKTERALVDAALDVEREQNGLEAEKFLERERKETDKNLHRERAHSDIQATATSSRLNHEVLAHIATRAELTSRDELLAIVSHDLRNPIGAVLSFSELLLEKHPANAAETGRFAAVIKRNAETALRLITDILDIERFAEGKLQMEFAPCDIDALISESVELLHHLASERNIELRAAAPLGGSPLSCDRDRILQVLGNLIGNAIKFTNPGGTITVGAEQLKNELRVSVKDTGPGIPYDEQQKIFERYTQIGKQDRRGLGLGLHIAAIMIEAHQGKIGVISEPGHGADFRFTLPLTHESR
jgi:signal transduction histidine kinase